MKYSRAILGIWTVGLVLRLLPLYYYWNCPSIFMHPDTWQYHRLAVNLLSGNGYSWGSAPPYKPNAYRPPGYPLVAAGLYWLTGPKVQNAVLLANLVGSSTIFLIYSLAWTVTGNRKVATAASALQAIDPLSIVGSNLLWLETYSAVVLLSGSLLVAGYFRAPRAWKLIILGLLLSLGIMYILFSCSFPPPWQLCRCFRHGPDGPSSFSRAVLAALLAWLPAACWMTRNWILFDYPGISCVTAVNMLKYKGAGVMAEVNGTSREAEMVRLTDEVEATLPSQASQGDRWRAWERKGRDILLGHLLLSIKVHLQGTVVECVGMSRDDSRRFFYGQRALDDSNAVSDQSIAECGRVHHRGAKRRACSL